MATINELLVRINADTTDIRKALEDSSKKLKDFENASKSVSKSIFTVFSIPLKNIFGYLKAGIDQFTAFGDAMDKAAQRTGVMASELSQLKFAAEQCGGSFEDVNIGLRDLAKNLAASEAGNTSAMESLSALDLSPAILAGMSMKDKFLEVADALSKCTSETQQTQLALKLFGEHGYKLLPMLKQGKAGIEELMAEASKLGIDISEADVKNAADMTDEINRLKSSVQSLVRQGIAAIAEPLTQVIECGRSWVEWAGKLIHENQWLITTLWEVGKALLFIKAGLMLSGIVKAFMIQIELARAAFLAFGQTATTMNALLLILRSSYISLTVAVSNFSKIVWASMATNPIGWILAAAAALVYLASCISGAKTKMEELSTSAKEAADNYGATADAIGKKIDRLQELSKYEELTNKEQNEAKLLLEQLKEAGYDVNEMYDEQTGKLKKVAEGYDNVRKSIKQKEIEALRAANREAMENMRKIDRNAEAVSNRYTPWWLKGTRLRELEKLEADSEAQRETILKNTQRIAELQIEAEAESKHDKAITDWRESEERKSVDKYMEEDRRNNLTDLQRELEDSAKKYAQMKEDTLTAIDQIDAQAGPDGKLTDELQKKKDAYLAFYNNLNQQETQAVIDINAKYVTKGREEDDKKREEKDKLRTENTNRLLELEKQLSEAGMTASQKELQALQEQNREIDERLKKENNLSEIQKARLEEHKKENQQKMDALLGDEVLSETQQKLKRLTEAFEKEKREYYEALASGNQQLTEQEKAQMEAAEEEVKKFSVNATKEQLANDEADLQAKEMNLQMAWDEHDRAQRAGAATPDEIAALQQAVAAAKDARDAAKKKVDESQNAFFRASDAAFDKAAIDQGFEDSLLGVQERGTFSSAQALAMSTGGGIQEKQLNVAEKQLNREEANGIVLVNILERIEQVNVGLT